MIVVACVLLMLVGGGVIVGLTMVSKTDKPTEDAGPQQPLAATKAQELMAKELSYKDLKFEDNPVVREIKDNEWKVESYLRHRNAAGKMVRMTYSARVRLEGPNDWHVEVLEVGGQRPQFASRVPLTKSTDTDDTPPIAPTPEPERDERTVARAMRTLGGLIDDSAAQRSTLVVWLFDTSPSAGSWREEVTRNFEIVYGSLRKHGMAGKSAVGKEAAGKKASADSEAKLQIAIVTFDDVVNVLTDQPLADEARLREVIGRISEGQGGHERPFAALQTALEKFGNFTRQGSRLQFVVVTDEAGDDEEKVIETAIPALKKAGVQVYVIGKEAPWGKATWPVASGSSGVAGGADPLRQGPESVFSERINLQFWERGFGEESIASPSGFGPYQLSRVCQQTGGAFFVGDGGEGGWSGGWGGREGSSFDRKARDRYAPKYMSADEHRKFMESNAAARALRDAGKLPLFEVVQLLALDFVAGDEARLAQAKLAAQRGVARTEPKLTELYEALKPGIADRPKLTEPRLQAAFDLAIGRVLAMQARVEGYNVMLAGLIGRRFKNAGSTTWVLQASEQTAAGSKYENAIKDARMYLDRVIKDHPNTPWAKEAQRELQSKMGWEWTER